MTDPFSALFQPETRVKSHNNFKAITVIIIEINIVITTNISGTNAGTGEIFMIFFKNEENRLNIKAILYLSAEMIRLIFTASIYIKNNQRPAIFYNRTIEFQNIGASRCFEWAEIDPMREGHETIPPTVDPQRNSLQYIW